MTQASHGPARARPSPSAIVAAQSVAWPSSARRSARTPAISGSLAPEQARPRDLLRLWRRHWWIENTLHWVRDAVFGEDASATRTGTAPRALSAVRNLAISLPRRWKRPDITAARQYVATHPAAPFRHLGLPACRQ